MTRLGAPPALAAILVGLLCLALRPTVPARRFGGGTPAAPAARSVARTITRTCRPLVPNRRPVIRPEVVASWCDELARRVRAGSSLRAALCETSAGDPALRASVDPVLLALERGATVTGAVAAAGQVPMRGHEHLALACSVIATAASIGGSASAPLERVAAALRLRAVDRQERTTQAAQARMSAHVMTVVPLFMLALLIATDGDVRAAVVSRAGAVCVLLGLALNALGWSWMRRIIGGVG